MNMKTMLKATDSGLITLSHDYSFLSIAIDLKCRNSEGNRLLFENISSIYKRSRQYIAFNSLKCKLAGKTCRHGIPR